MSFDNLPEMPTKSEMFIKLVTKSPINNNSVKNFYNVVKHNGPQDIMTHFTVRDNEGNIKNPLLVHRENEQGQHEYEIPLIRNLTANEIYQIVQNFNRTFNEGDYQIETSSVDNCCDDVVQEDIMPSPIFKELAEKLSEQLHRRWLNERLKNGWRFAVERNDKERTHPLIKPWDQLDESQKSIDYTLPEMFIDLLQQYGYTVISTDDLNRILEK